MKCVEAYPAPAVPSTPAPPREDSKAHVEMSVYRKQGDPDTWLMYNPNDKSWIVQATSDKGTDWGYAFLTCDPPCLPENGTKHTWQVLIDDSGDVYQLQADVDISIATPQEVAAAAEALAASVRADGHKVNEHTIYFRFSLFIKAHTLNNGTFN